MKKWIFLSIGSIIGMIFSFLVIWGCSKKNSNRIEAQNNDMRITYGTINGYGFVINVTPEGKQFLKELLRDNHGTTNK